MIIHASDLHNIPGMTVLDAFFRIISADCNHAPDPKAIAEHLHCLCNPLTYSHTLAQRTDDLMGIGLFQLIVADIFTDKIVNILLLLPLGKLCRRPDQLLHPGRQCLFMLLYLSLFKQILRFKNQIGRILIIFIMKSTGPEYLRMIQTQTEKQVCQLPAVNSGD